MPDTTITFREACRQDEGYLVDVTLETMQRVFESSVGHSLTKEAILEIIHSCDVTLIIEQDGRPVGYTCYAHTAPGRMYWASLVLSPHAQGGGIGRQVTRHIVQTARARGVRVIDGHVQLQNRRAVDYWFRRGFRPSGPPVQGSLPICLWI
ncbi:GNAT family N-acetyltransferase [Tumebacillus sp. DT12]|uniref:GNAT family N-acetyltransferase n=1 Tax=Tumebacillus lacus TaxID=2995335 RepID=A0ABT3WX67_9BACL|nr:GNAT family N-acetyltransferase [Tumebacillus lacus]MCX7568811.1 GNAT family N-acetyltransferase [Tumebacillus lacus]